MNKVTRTVITCAAVYILSFGLAAAVTGEGAAPKEDGSAHGETAVSSTAIKNRSYIIKEHNGVVAVYIEGEDTPALETDIFVNGLRAGDRRMVNEGITKDDYTEVLYLLEDLDS